ncbi:TPA: hypothetical protein U5D85_004384 [Yersinia enterocolitica]|nr:hypothetical protein [Yersinia enterocolitica]HEN3238350.1 hypothetical protein [Yersinia enterocolitica]HEN3333799.1 hypothetical protein [Yersinia enterocolitica]HEN3412041.1 hypothetical protein [Yersinia enterocolitica]HEN3416753.1 hypothetical protein [Yersinia enterocolitica]
MTGIFISSGMTMLHWLNTHIGTDWATYLGLGVSIIGLGITVFAAPKIIKKYKLRQTNKNNNGNINQAGRDLNITTINHISHAKTESGIEEKKKAHDLKIIEEILTFLPYEATLYEADQSSIVGMTYQFARNLNEAEKYRDAKYRLYNPAVNEVKDNFIIAITAFYNSLTPFLTVDHPEKEPLRLDLPYDWRNNPKSEKTYRKYQSEMCETSAVMIENYKLFIKTIKENDFITDTI